MRSMTLRKHNIKRSIICSSSFQSIPGSQLLNMLYRLNLTAGHVPEEVPQNANELKLQSTVVAGSSVQSSFVERWYHPYSKINYSREYGCNPFNVLQISNIDFCKFLVNLQIWCLKVLLKTFWNGQSAKWMEVSDSPTMFNGTFANQI